MRKNKTFSIILFVAITLLLVVGGFYYGMQQYYEYYQPFTQNKVALTADFKPVSSIETFTRADILKVQDVLLFKDVTDDERWFRYQNGTIVPYSKFLYWNEIASASGNDMTGEEAMWEFMERNNSDLYSLDEDYNIIDAQGNVKVKSVSEYIITKDWFYAITEDAHGKTSFVQPQGQFELKSSGTIREMAIDGDYLCVYETKATQKLIRVYSIEKQSIVCEIEGQYLYLARDKMLYQYDEKTFVFDLTKGESVALSKSLLSAANFDDVHIYFLTREGDLGRLNMDSLQIEMILISRVQNPLIQFYLDYLPPTMVTLN